MKTTSRLRYIALSFSLALFHSTHSQALDFDFGFRIDPLKDTPTLPGNCGVGGTFGSLCGIGNGTEIQDPDTTPFYQGQVTTLDGKTYWHIIVGDPNSGFAMESYTEAEYVKTGGFGSFSGGKPTDNGGLYFSPTGGYSGSPTLQNLEVISGNGWSPLSNGVDFTGNGSGDPTRTVLRQVMGDGIWDASTRTWSCDSAMFCSEFLKNRLAYKPFISQTINSIAGGVLAKIEFELDMRNQTYSDNTAAGTITNSVTLLGPSTVDGDFDMATDVQAGHSVVTGGRYVYNDCTNKDPFEGSCWQTFSVSGGVNDYQEGYYTYMDGGTDPMAYDWELYLDLDQSPNGLPGSGNQAKCSTASAPNSCN